MGHSVTYQFTKSRSAASAPRSQLRAHASAKKPLRLLELNEGGRGCRLVSSESWSARGFEEGGWWSIWTCKWVKDFWWLLAVCATARAASEPCLPQQQVFQLRWENFLTPVMSDKTHMSSDSGGGWGGRAHIQTPPPTQYSQPSALFWETSLLTWLKDNFNFIFLDIIFIIELRSENEATVWRRTDHTCAVRWLDKAFKYAAE